MRNLIQHAQGLGMYPAGRGHLAGWSRDMRRPDRINLAKPNFGGSAEGGAEF